MSPNRWFGRDGVGYKVKVAIAQPDMAVNHLKNCQSWDIQTLFDAAKNVGGRPIDPTKTKMV